MEYQKDCRYFLGDRPCNKNTDCNSRCPSKEITGKRILLIHLEALGAVLRTTSVARAIKSNYPNCHLTWVTSPLAVGLLTHNPFIDRVIKNDHNGVLELSNYFFDIAFVADKSAVASGILSVPKAIGERRGFAVDPISQVISPLNSQAEELYSLGLDNHKKFFVNKKPETQLLIEAAGLEYQNEDYSFQFSDSEKLKVVELKKQMGLERTKNPVIGLNTGCSPVIPFKKFSVDGWLGVIESIHKRFPESPILLMGGPEDAERNQIIASRSKIPVIETPTTEGLRKGFVYMDLVDIVVTGDSLGMHMAIALKKWVVAWFGPTCDHEIDLYNRGQKIKTLSSCSPCWKRQCDKPVMCYDNLEWSQIVSAVVEGEKLWRKQVPNVCWSSKPHSSETPSLRSRSSKPFDGNLSP